MSDQEGKLKPRLNTEDGCSRAQRSWKRQNCRDFHNKIRGGTAEYSEVEKEKLIHTYQSHDQQRCNWKEESPNRCARPPRKKMNPQKSEATKETKTLTERQKRHEG